MALANTPPAGVLYRHHEHVVLNAPSCTLLVKVPILLNL